MSFSDDMEVSIINHFFRNSAVSGPVTVYVALFSADPTDTGSFANEASGGSYARQALTLGAPGSTSGQASNSVAVTFPTATADYFSGANVTHFAICDASSGAGTRGIMVSAALTTAKAVLNGQRATFDIGTITLTVS